MRATIESWRDELESEKSEATAELADALAAQVAAEADRDAASAKLQALRESLVALSSQPLAHALARRVAAAAPDMRAADSRVMRAKGAAVAARERIADLTEALQQIARILPSETAEQEKIDADAD